MSEDREYIAVNIPSELIKEVDKMIGSLGYRSRAELVKEAIRALLRQYDAISKIRKNEENP